VKGYNWEIIATSWDTPEQVSFVNRVSTILGGKHVDYVLNQITKKASDLINKRNKDNVKPQHVKDKLFLTQEYDPEPRLQRPDEGDSDMPVTKFQRKIEVSDKFVEDLKNTDISKLASSLASAQQQKEKTDGAKKNIVRVPKLTTPTGQERRNRSMYSHPDGR
jgi:DNA topoisomerase-2